MTTITAGAWATPAADAIVDAGVSAAAFVPDSRLDGIISRLLERQLTVRTLTREEECVAYAAGRSYAGQVCPVLLQCSGLGNALNALGSLVVPGGLGVPLVVSMRGTLGETNPAQVPVGMATPALLAAVGIQSFAVRHAHAVVPAITGVIAMAGAGVTAAVLLESEIGGGRDRV
jgi:sulfopyruvate decarboxylase TPP-binding subunit